MKQELVGALLGAREATVQTWASRIHQSSSKYRSVPLEDVAANVGQFVDGAMSALGSGNYEALEAAIAAICANRAAMGFDVQEIQRGMLMGCEALLPALEQAFRDDAQKLVWSMNQIERLMQRAIQILHRQFEAAQARQAGLIADAADREAEATRRRLQAVLDAFGHAAVVAGPDLVFTWVDQRAASSQFGLHAPGDTHECSSPDPQECLLAAAFRTGEVQRSEATSDCGAQSVFPVKSLEGEVVEVIALF